MKAKPDGNYAIIMGDPGDPNSDFLRAGMEEVIGDAVKAGTIKIVGETYTDGWKPDNAQKNMEQILTAANNEVDAVLAENDGMAGGAAAALAAQGLTVPLGGQDGDLAAINRVARGTQTVSVWKNANDLGKAAGEISALLADGTALDAIPNAVKFSGGEKGVEMNAILLTPTPITKETIGLAIDAGHISKEQACEGAADDVAPASKLTRRPADLPPAVLFPVTCRACACPCDGPHPGPFGIFRHPLPGHIT